MKRTGTIDERATTINSNGATHSRLHNTTRQTNNNKHRRERTPTKAASKSTPLINALPAPERQVVTALRTATRNASHADVTSPTLADRATQPHHNQHTNNNNNDNNNSSNSTSLTKRCHQLIEQLFGETRRVSGRRKKCFGIVA